MSRINFMHSWVEHKKSFKAYRSDIIPERFFEKAHFEKQISRQQKRKQNYPVGKKLKT